MYRHIYCLFVLSFSDAVAYSSAYFGIGSGPIHLDDVACTGTEEALVNCSYDSHTADCSHFEDAGVRCSQTREFEAFFLTAEDISVISQQNL